MNILGINISHDTSVCLLKDGNIVFYAEEERFKKIKHFEADDKCTLEAILKLNKYVNHIDYVIFTTFKRFNESTDIKISQKIINDILSLNITLDKVQLCLEDHHLHHACNGFYNSGFEDSGVLVIDGSGSYIHKPYREIESSYTFSSNKINTNYKHYSSLNINYCEPRKIEIKIDESTEHLQIVSNLFGSGHIFNQYASLFNFVYEKTLFAEPGKLMGLSSYGNLNEEITWVEEYKNYPIFNLACIPNPKENKFNFQEMADVAKKVQEETKKHTIKLIQKTIDMSKSNNVVLSGGYFLNCVNNYEYVKAFPDINFYIDPICYDGGTAIGACFYVWHHILGNPNKMQKLDSLYLGF